ncbi:MAG TPA: hypothetical protein VK636_11225, partial [Gemmatimonadaceae bacterium]|nr:hypothetical protein [Gemmatimonadaceae bacterium]
PRLLLAQGLNVAKVFFNAARPCFSERHAAHACKNVHAIRREAESRDDVLTGEVGLGNIQRVERSAEVRQVVRELIGKPSPSQ